MEVVQCLSGKTLDAMHQAISTGRMACMMGAQIFFQRLGQLEPVLNPKKRKTPTDETHVVLGKQRQTFRVVPVPATWSELFGLCSDVDPIRVPEDVEQLRGIIQTLNAWLKRFPQKYHQGGKAKDDEKLNAGYIRKHILRKFLLALTNKTPKAVTGALTWKDTLCAVPDRGGHARELDGAATWERIEADYGMNPLMISCWACLFGAVPKAQQDSIFARPTPQLVQAARELVCQNGLAPAPMMLAAHLTA